ncbi:MAG: CaiB/BaiF CoA transferase family protein [Panacagrimonas sp.]
MSEEKNPLLAGIRVLDLSRLLPGPFCSLYLAQMGAEVIKIEEPKGGDYARSMSADMFDIVNRGKKSVTLDLRQDADRQKFFRLVKSADVVLESFRPGVMDKLGCGFEAVRAANPRIVFAALTGYGHTGPYRDRPGHDMNYRGYAGELDQTGAVGQSPAPGNLQVADLAGGALTCLAGILAALFGARASGVGTFVDVAMLDGTLALQVLSLSTLRQMGEPMPRGKDFLSGAMPNYSVYECADGRFFALGSLERKFFEEAMHTAGRPDLLKLPMAAGPKGDPLRQELVNLFKTRTRDEWETLLAHLDTCGSGVLTPAEVLQNEQVLARGMVETLNGKPAYALPIQFSHASPRSGPSPKLGQHNDEVLGSRSAATPD